MSVASQYDLCLSGDALHHLQQQGADTSYVPLTQVCPQAPLESTQEPAASHIIKGMRCCLKSDLGSTLLLCVLGLCGLERQWWDELLHGGMCRSLRG